jgi:hypothetical protein
LPFFLRFSTTLRHKPTPPQVNREPGAPRRRSVLSQRIIPTCWRARVEDVTDAFDEKGAVYRE